MRDWEERRGGGGRCGNAAEWDEGKGNIKTCMAPIGVGSVLRLLFRAAVGVLLDLGLIINPETAQTSTAVHT